MKRSGALTLRPERVLETFGEACADAVVDGDDSDKSFTISFADTQSLSTCGSHG